MHHRDEGDILPDIVDHFQQVHKNLDFYRLKIPARIFSKGRYPLIVESFLDRRDRVTISR